MRFVHFSPNSREKETSTQTPRSASQGVVARPYSLAFAQDDPDYPRCVVNFYRFAFETPDSLALGNHCRSSQTQRRHATAAGHVPENISMSPYDIRGTGRQAELTQG